MELDNPIICESSKIKIALEKSLSSEEKDREESFNYLSLCKQDPNNYCLSLLEILLNSKKISNNNNNVSLIYSRVGSVQLKNLIKENWKNSTINEQTKKRIKENIIKLFINSTEKLTLKVYQEIIRKIIKYESSWDYYLDNIQEFLSQSNIDKLNNNNENNLFIIYCGLECFYFLSEKYEYENEREIYNDCYNSLHNKLFYFFNFLMDQLKLYYKTLNNNNVCNMNSNINNNLLIIAKKCINKILKIFIKSIQMFPPKGLVDGLEHILLKIFEYDIQIDVKITKLILWFLFDLYQKYFDYERTKKEYYHSIFSNLSKQYLIKIFYYILNFINMQNSFDNISLASSYKFLELAYQRKDILIYDLILSNLKNIMISTIKNNCITNKIYLLSEKEFVYYLVDSAEESKRSILNFTELIAKNKDKGLIFKLIEEVYTQIQSYYINKYLIPLESGIYLIKILINNYNDFNKTKEIYKNIISNIISNNLNFDKINNAIENNLICRCVDFLSLLDKGNDFSQAENIYLLDKLNNGINITNNLSINTVCALVFPKIIEKNKNLINYYKRDVLNLFKRYILIIKETELEIIIKALECLIKIYNVETLNFINNLTQDLVNLFIFFTSSLSDLKDDKQTDLDSSSCEIIKTLVILFRISSTNSHQNFNELINLCNDLIIFGISEKGGELSNELFENDLYLINSILDFSVNIDDNSNLWKYLDIILDSVITFNNNDKYKDNNIFNNNIANEGNISNINNLINTNNVIWKSDVFIINENEVTPGRSFDILQKIVPIIFNFIIKNPFYFLNYLYKTFIIFKTVILISKKESDFIQCCYSIKIYICIFEMFVNKNIIQINNILTPIIHFIIDELSVINKKEDYNYLKFIIQLASVVLAYNPNAVLNILNKENKLSLLFEKIIDSLNIMNFEYECKRILFGLFSLFTVKFESMPKILFDNIKFISKKIIEVLLKYQKIIEKKLKRLKKKEENLNNKINLIKEDYYLSEDFGEENEEEDDEENYEPGCESLSDDDDNDDDSTVEENYHYKKLKGLKTKLEEIELKKYIFDLIINLQNSSNQQYKFLCQSFGEEGYNIIMKIITSEN